MNPDQPSREQIETRITALLLGELPADEAALLRYTISQDPALKKLHDQIESSLPLVREAAQKKDEAPVEKPAPLKLSAEKRAKLLAHFKTARTAETAPKEPLFWLKRIHVSSTETLVVGALVFLVIAGITTISLPNFVKARSTSQANAVVNNMRQIDAAKMQWALENHKTADDTPSAQDLTPYLKGGAVKSVTGEAYVFGKVSEPVSAVVDSKAVKGQLSGMVVTELPSYSLSLDNHRVRISLDQDIAAAPLSIPPAPSAAPSPIARREEAEAQLKEMEKTPAAQPAHTATQPTPIALPAEQPEAGQLAYDHGANVAGILSDGSQSRGGLMSADEIAGHVIAPKNSQVYSQNVVGFSGLAYGGQPSQSTEANKPASSGTWALSLGNAVTPGHSLPEYPIAHESPVNPASPISAPPVAQPAQIVLPQAEPTSEIVGQGGTSPTTGTDKPAIQFADSESVLRQPDIVVTKQKELEEANKIPSSGTLNGVAINFYTAPGGTGGVGGGGGGGIGGVNSFGGGEKKSDGSEDRNGWVFGLNGSTGAPPAQNAPQAAPGQALGVPAAGTFAFDDAGVDGSRAQTQTIGPPANAANPIGAFPATTTPAAGTELASESTKSESPERRFQSTLTERGTGTAAANRFYRNPTAETVGKPVPMAGDIPVMGSLFQSSTAASTLAPAQPAAPPEDTFAIDGGIQQQPAEVPQRPRVMRQGLATLSTQSSPPTQSTGTTQQLAFAGNYGPATANVGPSSPGADNVSTTASDKPAIAEPKWTGILELTNGVRDATNHFFSRYAFSGGIGGGGQFMGGSQSLESTNLIVINGSGNYAGNRGRSANVNIGGWAPPKKQEELIAPGEINFQGVDVSEALDAYAKLTGRTILRGALPQGQIILNTQSPLTKSETIEALQAVLALNGVSTVNVGDKFVKALPSDQAGTAGGEIDRSGSTNVPALGSYVTRVVQLKYLKPSEMVQVIQPFAGVANSIVPMDTNGLLVLRDKPENVNRMVEMIDQVDVNVPAETISEVVPIHYAKVDDIASALKVVQLVDQAKIISNQSSSGLLIYATRADMETIKENIAKLDTPTDLPLRQPAPNTPVPQPEILTSSNAFSTFAMNVSDVSFKFAEASLQNGKLPDTASIRSEEFINAFDYRDPEAAAGQPMAFTSEQALYPFAHNRELLRFSVKTAAAGRQEGRPLNLVLLLDTSGSMERADRVEIVREALRVLSSQLHENDIVSVVSFARTARLWADGISGDKAGETLDQVGSITPDGGTNLEEAMRLAYETARRHYLSNGMNRVVLLTDGAANLGDVDPTALQAKVETQRKQGIALDCFGIGWEDLNDDLLEELSSHGDGRYAFLNSPEDATKDFAAKLAGALQVAAQDLKVQVEFNPQRVTAYRQIGYAKHQLTKEQFRDNTVAAGEIAAQEAGNALYTIDVKPDGEGPIATVHVRYRIPGTQDYREHSWDVEYTGHTPALDQSSPAMRLAATASAFSEWLAASPYAQEVTPDALLNYLSGVPEVYGADDRPKQLETMIREAKSLEGK